MQTFSALGLAFVLLGVGAVVIDDVGPEDRTIEASTAAETHHVHIEDFEMDPDPIVIEQGDTVEWHNHDSVSHTATADDGSWDTGTIPSGGTESITFDEITEDSYHCAVHPESMTGYTLEVTEPNEDPTVSIEEPEDGSHLEGEVTIAGTASDPDGSVDEVEVRIDEGDWQTAEGTSAWNLVWDTAREADGEHTIEARSFDGQDHSPLDTVTVTTENPNPDLAVTSLVAESGIGETTIAVTLANEGDVASQATELAISYEAENAEGEIAREPVEALAPGQTHESTTSWETLDKVGSFEVSALVDPDGVVLDPNPDNDRRAETVCVPGVEGVTCVVPGTQVPP